MRTTMKSSNPMHLANERPAWYNGPPAGQRVIIVSQHPAVEITGPHLTSLSPDRL